MPLPTIDPPPVLRSARLRLASYVPEDAKWVARLASPMEVARYTGLPHPMDESAAARWLARHAAGVAANVSRGFAARLVDVDTREETPIGGGSVRRGSDDGIVTVGFWLGTAFSGRGLGTEIARLLVEHAFVDLRVRRVEADCAHVNVASRRVLEKAGLRLEGTAREGFARFGEVYDSLKFGALHSDPR